MVMIPLHEDCITSMCGRHVCVVMKDGHRHTGILTACREGKVFLNGGEHSIIPRDEEAPKHEHKKRRKHCKCKKPCKCKNKSATSKSAVDSKIEHQGCDHHPHHPQHPHHRPHHFGPPIGLELGLISVLFLLYL